MVKVTNRLKKLTNNIDDSNNILAEYDYDEFSRRTLLTLGNDANAVYDYDIANRVKILTNNVNDVNIVFDYSSYDKVGNRLSCKIDDANAHVYLYDEIYRLIFVDYNDGNESHGRRIVAEALLNVVLENPDLSRVQMKLIQGQEGDITNALRHACISALLYRKETENDAEQALLIHEAVWEGDPRDMEADMWNNAIGMKIGLSKGNIIEGVLKSYYEGELASWTGGMMKPLVSVNKCKK